MANNDQNIRLRVSAQAEGLNELQRVTKQLDQLSKTQEAFAKTAGTAGRTLADLERDLKALDTTARTINGLQQLGDDLDRQRRESRRVREELRRARAAALEYESSLAGAGKRTQAQTAETKKYRAEISRLEAVERKTFETRRRLSAQLREQGVSGGRGGRAQVNALAGTAEQLLRQNREEIDGFDRRLAQQRQITAELERQRQAVRARIAAERQASSGFARFSRGAEDAPLRALQRDVQERARAERQAALVAAREQARAAEEFARREREKTEALRREVRRRIEAERQVGSGFGAFSRAAAGAPARSREADRRAADAAAAELAARAARRDADLADRQQQTRAIAFEQRLQRVLADRPALLDRSTQATRRGAQATQQSTQAQRGLADELRRVAGQGRTTLDFFQRLRGQVLELAATYGSLVTTITLAQQAVSTSIERTGIQNRLLFANDNNAKRTAEDLSFVRTTADRLGQSFNNLATLYSRFAAASSAANQPVATTRRIFEQLTEAFTVLGLTQDDVTGSFRALEQSISKGKVQAEELRGQLGDRFPGASQRFAKAINVSVQELDKLLEAGRISSNAIEFFAEDIALAARATLPSATNSLRATLERLKSSFQDFLVTIVNSGFGDELSRLARQLSEFFKGADGAQFARSISGAFSVIVTAARLLTQNIDAVFFAFRVFVGYLAGRVFAGAVAGAITGFAALGRTLRVATVALTGAGAAAGRAAVGVRTLTAALGPVALAIGLAATALVEFGLNAADAERQAQDLSDELRRLAAARGEELAAARESNAEQLKEIENTRTLIALKIEEAEKRLAAARAANVEAQRSTQAAARSGAPVRFGNLSASADVSAARGALDDLRAEDKRLADEQSKRQKANAEASARLAGEGAKARDEALRQSAQLETELNDANNQRQLKQDDAYYNTVAKRTEEIAKLTSLARRAGTLEAADEDRLQRRLDAARAARVQVRGAILPGKPEKGSGSAKAEAEKRAREIAQLEEEVQKERERSQRDSLRRLTEEEETAAAARVDLIKLEYAEKIAEQKKFEQQARQLQQPTLAAQFAENIKALEAEREAVVSAEQRKIAVEALRKSYEDLNTALQNTVARRDAEIERINTERDLGRLTDREARAAADRVTQETQPRILQGVAAIRDLIDANRDALGKMFNVDEILLELDALQIKTEAVVTEGQRRAQELRESFAQGSSQAFTTLGQGIAGALREFNSFGDAIRATGEAFLNFAADFLVNIGQMIAEQTILNALQEAAKNSEGGVFGTIGNLISNGLGGGADAAAGAAQAAALNAASASLSAAGATLVTSGGTLSAAGGTLTAGGATLSAASGALTAAAAVWQAVAVQIQSAAAALAVANAAGSVGGFHTGGVIGTSAPTFTRRVSMAAFTAAPRYHSGGVIGFRPDEVPAILQKGEEVLAKNDPRNVMNGGGASAGANVQIVNAIDPVSVVRAGLQGPAGRQIITNIFEANKAQFRQYLAS